MPEAYELDSCPLGFVVLAPFFFAGCRTLTLGGFGIGGPGTQDAWGSARLGSTGRIGILFSLRFLRHKATTTTAPTTTATVAAAAAAVNRSSNDNNLPYPGRSNTYAETFLPLSNP